MVRSRFTRNGDVRLHYLESRANDTRAPVLFVPGMTDVAEDYVDVLPTFERRTAVMELRGHGKSGAPARGYDAATLSADVAAVVDDVTTGPVHLVTFSRGTTYALMWALGNAHRVRSLSIGDYTPEERALPDDVSRRLVEGRWRGTRVSDRLDVTAALDTFRTARDRSYWEPLARQRFPLLVVRSGDGVLISEDEWSRYRRMFPEARLVEFPDSPHDIFRPDRERYPRLVRQHVDRADEAVDGPSAAPTAAG
ncbi:alpha/beta fold hydrolase [Mycolicibacterium sp. XJ1819]